MKGLGDRDNHNILIKKSSYTRGFTEDELNLLNDLLIFNYKYEEAFFNNKIDEDVLEIIDSVIEEKLKSISPDLAFKFLNRIWTLYSEGKTTLDAKIINGVDFDLSVNRLSIQLLDRATDDGKTFFNNYKTRNGGLRDYLNFNFYNRIYNIGSKANKMLILDHVELFLALLNESTEIEYERYIINYHTDIREENIAIQFAFEAMSMLSYKDKDLTEEDREYLKIGKIYLDSLLMLLKDFEKDKVLSYYQENEKNVDTKECTKALSYVKKSIEERDKKTKRNS